MTVQKKVSEAEFSASIDKVESGINWRNVLLGLAAIALLVFLSTKYFPAGCSSETKEEIPTDKRWEGGMPSTPAGVTYADMKPKPAPADAPAAEDKPADPPKEGDKEGTAKEDPKEDPYAELFKEALTAEIHTLSGSGTADASGKGEGEAESQGLTSFGNDGEGLVVAGTAIPFELNTAIKTNRAGGVRARVTHDVWNEDKTCVAIPAGSVFTGMAEASNTRGESTAAAKITSLRLTNGEIIGMDDYASDQLGRSGIQGRKDSNAWKVAGLILGEAILGTGKALASQSRYYGINELGDSAEGPLSQVMRDQLSRPTAVSVDPTDGNGSGTIILQKDITVSECL